MLRLLRRMLMLVFRPQTFATNQSSNSTPAPCSEIAPATIEIERCIAAKRVRKPQRATKGVRKCIELGFIRCTPFLFFPIFLFFSIRRYSTVDCLHGTRIFYRYLHKWQRFIRTQYSHDMPPNCSVTPELDQSPNSKQD
jgi:hypothetical protein